MNSRRPSGTCEIPRRTMASAARPVISCPSIRTRPAAGTISPEMARSRVDLPAPLGPMTETISPARTFNETRSRARACS